ncbi:MAG: dethiobiotin synthase [Elusimicrobia bacterium]|nr:dethiobiotin synthase [Elusimicrobiota bacterium]
MRALRSANFYGGRLGSLRHRPRFPPEPINLSFLAQAFGRLGQRHPVMVVEGVGGLMVPLTAQLSGIDLIQAIGLPVLVVARAGLGTLNHTLLTVEALERRGIPILGVLLNGRRGHSAAERTNPNVLRTWMSIPLLGTLWHRPVYQRNFDCLAYDLSRLPELVKALRGACGVCTPSPPVGAESTLTPTLSPRGRGGPR